MVSLSSNLTEEEVKLRYITPAIEKAGWGKNRIRMEPLIEGRILIDGGESYRSRNTSHLKPDYLLMTSGGKYLAVVEAKNMDHSISEGIQQSKNYASILDVPFAFSSNGVGFYEFDFNTGLTRELSMGDFPSEDELLARLESGCGIDKDSAVLYPMHYDGVASHSKYLARDVAKNDLCSRLGVKIIRIREEGCPEISRIIYSVKPSIMGTEYFESLSNVISLVIKDILDVDMNVDGIAPTS
ncbi:MAG: type I restriction enzyme HsdR N-terminal domain-containing protein [Candidatus Methanomethylophilaceae archaeon]|nr:type I restriction enzyme HsdR N-terminal domain-containing protein [Candidatus Methanomethylophilaceae archaeon]